MRALRIIGIQITDINVEIMTKLATSFGFRLNLCESKQDVTAIGVVNCKINTAEAILDRLKIKEIVN